MKGDFDENDFAPPPRIICVALGLCLPGSTSALLAQTQLEKTTHGYIDKQAKLAHQGDETATRNAVIAMFETLGINPQIPKAFGFQERIVQAQLAYVRGGQIGIQDADVATALNNLGNVLNTPAWSRTNASEIRRVRVLDLQMYPNLLLSRTAVKSGETPHLLDDVMSPLEALHVSTSLVMQKLYTPAYQFTGPETAAVGNSRAAVARLSGQKGTEFRQALFGTTSQRSIRDMLWVAGTFFNDLKLNQVKPSGGAR